MSPEAILLSIRDRAGEGFYRFSCPECLNTIEKPADRKVVALLLSAGVELADGDGGEAACPELAPSGVTVEPPESRPPGPPFTVDDLITFHFLLRDDALLKRAFPVE